MSQYVFVWGGLEKSGFKMWRGIQNKKRALTMLPHYEKQNSKKNIPEKHELLRSNPTERSA